MTDFKKAGTILFRNYFTCYLNRCGAHPWAGVLARGRRLAKTRQCTLGCPKFGGMTLLRLYVCICHRLNNAFSGGFWTHQQYFLMKTTSFNAGEGYITALTKSNIFVMHIFDIMKLH